MNISKRFVLGEHLTPEQHQFFEEFGFIHFKNFLSREQIQEILVAIHELELYWIEKGITKVNGIPIKFGTDLDGSAIVQRFAFASLYSEVLHNFMCDERLLTLKEFIEKESRLAEEEKDGLVINHYINSGESGYTKLGWHTDSMRDIFLGINMNPMVNVGTSLDDSPREKGSLRVIPGSHKQSMFDLLFKKRYLNNDPDEEEFILETEAGDLTVHHGRIWHRVARATISGEASRRRVMYFPIISGKYKPKSENSRTPFYHKFQRVVK